jgi:hypothetical protein
MGKMKSQAYRTDRCDSTARSRRGEEEQPTISGGLSYCLLLYAVLLSERFLWGSGLSRLVGCTLKPRMHGERLGEGIWTRLVQSRVDSPAQ